MGTKNSGDYLSEVGEEAVRKRAEKRYSGKSEREKRLEKWLEVFPVVGVASMAIGSALIAEYAVHLDQGTSAFGISEVVAPWWCFVAGAVFFCAGGALDYLQDVIHPIEKP